MAHEIVDPQPPGAEQIKGLFAVAETAPVGADYGVLAVVNSVEAGVQSAVVIR